MTELKIIAKVTIMGIIISIILLPVFYPDNWSMNNPDMVLSIVLGLMFGSFYFLLEEVYKNVK